MEKNGNIYNASVVGAKIERFFNGNVIGSFLLLKDGLSPELINDLDIAIYKSNYLKVQEYLEDLGYSETKKGYVSKGYGMFNGSLVFTKENEIPIHLCFKNEDFKLYSFKELIGEKFLRSNESDIKQLAYLLQNKNVIEN
jgi:hypothetical protein